MHIPGGGAIAHGALATEMFLGLKQGYSLHLTGASVVPRPSDLSLHLSSQDFFPAMQEFMHCAHTQTAVAWSKISRTRVPFDVDAHAVDMAPQLDALVAYVKHSGVVSRIYIDGHTDSSGTERGNKLLAKRRAESVAAYLTAKGLSKDQMVVRYHGQDYPVADNKTVAGKAQNRRTTVRLAR